MPNKTTFATLALGAAIAFAGPAFAEAIIALRIHLAAFGNGGNIAAALAHRLAALEHNGPDAELDQLERGKYSSGTEADDYCRLAAANIGQIVGAHALGKRGAARENFEAEKIRRRSAARIATGA